MAVRDILNYLGEKIGELELSDDASERDWSNALGTYALPPASPLIPDVTPRQIRQALVISGVSIANIEAALDTLPEPTKSLAKIEWEFSISFQRNRPLVVQMGQMLGWSSAQLDALWALAASL